MAFNCLANTGGTLSVTIPPKILQRDAGGAKVAGVAIGLDGHAAVTEWPQAVAYPKIVLRWEYLSGAAVTTIRAILAAGGLVTVVTASGVSSFLAAFGAIEEQQITPFLGEYPDKLQGGSAQIDSRLACTVQLTLYRM